MGFIILVLVVFILFLWVVSSVFGTWFILSHLFKPRNWAGLLMLAAIVPKFTTKIPYMGWTALALLIIWSYIQRAVQAKLETFKEKLESKGWKYYQGKDGKYWHLPSDPELVKYQLEEAVIRQFGKNWGKKQKT